jgi:DNA-directed RNA polymerase subunit M/transcription elongation factor TFIIS
MSALTTDDMRNIALSLNDGRLNREQVSVNQIRELARALGYVVEERDGDAMTELEAPILDGDTSRWRSVLADHEEAPRPCQHQTHVVEQLGEFGIDDHETDYVKCQRCGAGWVVTVFASGRKQSRPMTEKEVRMYAKL